MKDKEAIGLIVTKKTRSRKATASAVDTPETKAKRRKPTKRPALARLVGQDKQALADIEIRGKNPQSWNGRYELIDRKTHKKNGDVLLCQWYPGCGMFYVALHVKGKTMPFQLSMSFRKLKMFIKDFAYFGETR